VTDPGDVPRETRARLDAFATLLLRWNRVINLIARGDEPEIWQRHIADSLQLVPFISPGTARAIDLGTGGGFPGLALAIATQIPFDLVEADQRKAAFLREAGRALGVKVTVHAVRAEAVKLEPAPLITSRALAPLPRLLTLSAPLLSPGGICLFLKGVNVESELTSAAREWHMHVERVTSQTAPGASILRISDIARVHDNARSRDDPSPNATDAYHGPCQPKGRRRQDHNGDQSGNGTRRDGRKRPADRPGPPR
jgi:16S rRNA (guanine527-N7)-methyltransferase